MNSANNYKPVNFEVSWGFIQQAIETAVRTLAKGKLKDSENVMSIKLDYAGGYVAQDKVIPVEVLVQKEVRTLRFGKRQE